MIIWDEINQRHWIKLGPEGRINLPAIKVIGNQTYEDVELLFKQVMAPSLNQASGGFYCRLHIKTYKPLDYVLWVGPLGSEPSSPPGYEWWEEIIDGKIL